MMTQDEPPSVVFVWAVTFTMSISNEVLVFWYNTECLCAARIVYLVILKSRVSFRQTIYFKLLKIFNKLIKKFSRHNRYVWIRRSIKDL
jgi:hypothetical protein